MSLFQNLFGTMSSTLLIGGPSGIMIKKVTNGLEIRNKDGSALRDLTADNLIANTAVKADVINENTVGAGVTVSSVLIKNGLVDGKDVSALANDIDVVHKTGAEVILGVKDFQNGIKADTVSESTTGAGVTVSGVLIKDGLVDGIDVSVLDSTVIKKDGTVAFTADQSMGSHKLTNLATPTAGTDATTKTYVDGAVSSAISTAEGYTDTAIGAVQTEVNNIETGAGLNTDGTYTANASANYINGASSLKDADNILDGRAKTNADAITALQGSVIKKDGTVAFTADQSMGGNKIVNLGLPTNTTDAVNKEYVDSLSQGLIPHVPVIAATTAPLSVVASGSQVGKTLTASANGPLVLDSIVLTTGQRVLIKDQANAVDNGVYTVTNTGSASTKFVLTRATDFDGNPSIEVSGGDYVFVEQGTANINNAFAIIANTTVVVDTDNIIFAQVSTVSSIVAGDALVKTGNRLDVLYDNSTIDLNGSNELEIKAGGITNTQISASAAIAWSKISKTLSSLADLATRNFSDLQNIPTQIDFTALSAYSPLAGTEEVCIYVGGAYRKTTVADIRNGLALDSAVVHKTGAETISGVKDFQSGIKADTISESTADAGVTVDGLLIKNGVIPATGVDVHNATAKITPADADELILADSANGFAVKKITRSNLLAGIASANGIAKHIKLTVGTANVSSVTTIPSGAVIKSVTTCVKTSYTAGATLQVLVNGTTPITIQDTVENDLTYVSVYESRPFSDVLAANAGAVQAVISGSPSSGSCTVIIEYVEASLS